MPDNLHAHPQAWRELALQHEEVSRNTLAWAQPPTEWLADFPRTFGAIAQPVYEALLDYYDARFRAGKALADENDYIAASLRASADALENADQEGGAMIRVSGDSLGGPATVPPAPAPSPGGVADGAAPANPPVAAGGPTATPAPGDTVPGVSAMPTLPGTVPPAPDAAGIAAGLPGSLGAAGSADQAPFAAPAHAPADMTTPAGVPTALPGAGDGRALPPDTPTPPPVGPMPMPMPIGATPFASAVRAAKLRDAGTGHVVNEDENADLVLARTLLAAVLAATETSAVGVNWAVAVLRGPSGAAVFLTSDEGRGWLPAGLYLPRAVSTPWTWDGLLGAEGSPWEGLSDPARVLVEFGRARGGRDGMELSALASSGPIAANLRAALDGVATVGDVAPVIGVDLRVFTPDTTDRLGVGGSIAALEQIAAVPDAAIRRRCVQLALDAQARVGGSSGRASEAADVRRLRERILARVDAGSDVPPQWWQELRQADELLITTMVPHRLDTDRIDLGELRFDEQAAALRALTFERRCDELVLLLAGTPDRQCLRDAVYAHEQIVGHPQFAAAAVSATEAGVSVGVPGGASAAPQAGTPPPVPRNLSVESGPS
ncbi:type VII secretion target [Nocardia colli]|uniref:type VII secretion target n=1 Tax=Nocardia colli TaxID=2545717 RepID=UPI0035D595A3